MLNLYPTRILSCFSRCFLGGVLVGFIMCFPVQGVAAPYRPYNAPWPKHMKLRSLDPDKKLPYTAGVTYDYAYPRWMTLMPDGRFIASGLEGATWWIPLHGKAKFKLHGPVSFPDIGQDGRMWDSLTRYNPWTGKTSRPPLSEYGSLTGTVHGTGYHDWTWMNGNLWWFDHQQEPKMLIKITPKLGSNHLTTTRYPTQPTITPEIARESDIYSGPDGRIWIRPCCLSEKGLYYANQNGEITYDPNAPGGDDYWDDFNGSSYVGTDTTRILTDRFGYVWSGHFNRSTLNFELTRYNPKTWAPQTIQIPPDPRPEVLKERREYAIESLQPGPDGNFWFIYRKDYAAYNTDKDEPAPTIPDTTSRALLGRITIPSGKIRFWTIESPEPTYAYPRDYGHPRGLNIGPDGNLWLTYSNNLQIAHIPIPNKHTTPTHITIQKHTTLQNTTHPHIDIRIQCTGMIGQYCYANTQLQTPNGTPLTKHQTLAIQATPKNTPNTTIIPLQLNKTGQHLLHKNPHTNITLTCTPKNTTTTPTKAAITVTRQK